MLALEDPLSHLKHFASTNHSALNNLAHTPLHTNVEEYIYRKFPRRKIIGSKGMPISNFDRSCPTLIKLLFIRVVPILCFHHR